MSKQSARGNVNSLAVDHAGTVSRTFRYRLKTFLDLHGGMLIFHVVNSLYNIAVQSIVFSSCMSTVWIAGEAENDGVEQKFIGTCCVSRRP
jgi:hypothetical protein